MRNIDTIVMATDFSLSAKVALPYAMAFAKTLKARLVIAVVYDPMHVMIEMLPELGLFPDVFPASFPPREKLEKALEPLADQARAEGIPTKTTVKDGRAYVSLIHLAQELKAGMLIMGTRGLTGMDRALIGSTAEQVVRMAPCPVLTVRGPGREQRELRRTSIESIVVPVDFSAFSREAVECILPIAAAFKAKVHFVHAEERHFYGIGPLGFTTRAEARQQVRRYLSDQMAELVLMCLKRGLEATSAIRDGRPEEQIVAVAEETHADLIAMATHGRTGLSHALIGSIAEKVVRSASCAVLTFKSPTFQFSMP